MFSLGHLSIFGKTTTPQESSHVPIKKMKLLSKRKIRWSEICDAKSTNSR
ncbi:uncharacterized protein OCT59_021629 [Rhizophagus irregularis]|nr:hypothetical protein OCT59_021629 [Rhizophagus irregularis]